MVLRLIGQVSENCIPTFLKKVVSSPAEPSFLISRASHTSWRQVKVLSCQCPGIHSSSKISLLHGRFHSGALFYCFPVSFQHVSPACFLPSTTTSNLPQMPLTKDERQKRAWRHYPYQVVASYLGFLMWSEVAFEIR